jgi:hypothetical protein
MTQVVGCSLHALPLLAVSLHLGRRSLVVLERGLRHF